MNKLLARYLGRFFSGVSAQEKINFARNLSIAIKAGLPILEGLKMLKKQTGSKALSRIFDALINDISNGQFLAIGLERFPSAFDSFFVNIVRVGEATGTLSANLAYLADELKKSHTLKNKIRSAMVYPVIIMIATLTLVFFLIFFVLPKILPLLVSLNVNVPLSTKILIAVTEFMLARWFSVVGGLIGLVLIARFLFLLKPVRLYFDKLLLFVPVFSGLIIDVNVVNFTRTFAVLLRAGIKIVEALEITAATFDNLVYRQELLRASENIRKGGRLAQYLSMSKKTFPGLLCGLVEIGERTGNLEDNLVYLSEYYKEEAELRINNLTTLIEPILLLFMGLLVGFVAISIITPIYSITQGVGR